MRVFALFGLALWLLAGCASQRQEEADLALTCQLTTCTCAGPDRLFLSEKEAQPVLWKENGDAYCPEGLELKIDDKKKN